VLDTTHLSYEEITERVYVAYEAWKNDNKN
jgi:hypothetical protein